MDLCRESLEIVDQPVPIDEIYSGATDRQKGGWGLPLSLFVLTSNPSKHVMLERLMRTFCVDY